MSAPSWIFSNRRKPVKTLIRSVLKGSARRLPRPQIQQIRLIHPSSFTLEWA